MTLDSRWKHKYGTLKNFILSEPGIYIRPTESHIPPGLRDRFYGYFDDVRMAIVESWCGSSRLDLFALSKNYQESEGKLAESLNLKVELPTDLSSILHNPKGGMMRLLYNRLFELIQGKISENDFEKMVEVDLETRATEMFQLGYETWAALALVNLLEPDELLGVALDHDAKPVVAGIEGIAPGRQFHHHAKRIPEFILHSMRLNRYVAFKMPLTREVNSYYVPVEIPTQRLLRNRNGDTSSVLDHRMIFLSVVPDQKKIPVFADLHERRISGPDLTIEFLSERDLSDEESIRQIQNRLQIMRPRRGGVMVLMDSCSKPLQVKAIEDIVISSVRLELSGLQPILDKLC